MIDSVQRPFTDSALLHNKLKKFIGWERSQTASTWSAKFKVAGERYIIVPDPEIIDVHVQRERNGLSRRNLRIIEQAMDCNPLGYD